MPGIDRAAIADSIDRGCNAMTATTDSMTETARAFFDACETGQGWAACSAYCQPDASFTAQAEPLAEMQSLEQYTDWMKGLLVVAPDGRYALKSFATDPEHNSVAAYAVFSGTHTGEGGPVPPTGQSTNSDYVYVMEFDDGKTGTLRRSWIAGGPRGRPAWRSELWASQLPPTPKAISTTRVTVVTAK